MNKKILEKTTSNTIQRTQSVTRLVSYIFSFLLIASITTLIISSDIPTQFTTDSASTILTTAIGIESLLIGFIIVAYYFINQEYIDYYATITCLTHFFSSSPNELTDSQLKQKKVIEHYLTTIRDFPKFIRISYIINFCVMVFNLFYMLILLIQIDTTQVYVSLTITNNIFHVLFLIGLNMFLVGIGIIKNAQFADQYGLIKGIEKSIEFLK